MGSCSNAKRPNTNAKGGLKAWTSAGFPANQIVLGIASYGYISKSTAKELVIRDDRSAKRQETSGEVGTGNTAGITGAPTGSALGSGAISTAARSATPSTTSTGVEDDVASQKTSGGDDDKNTTDGSTDDTADSTTSDTTGSAGDSIRTSGSISLTPDQGGNNMIVFNSLIKQGALTSDYKGAKGFTRLWDKCSSTPFLRSETADQVVSYDDPQSIMLKGQFVKESGMLGTNMWDISGDTKGWALMNAARKGMGISSKSSSSGSQTSVMLLKSPEALAEIPTAIQMKTQNDGLTVQGPNTGGDSTAGTSGRPSTASQISAVTSGSLTANQTPVVNGGDASASTPNDQSGTVGGFNRRRRRIYSSSER